jgi:hypothetical protein
MGKLGNIGVILVLSLILSMALFTASAFAQQTGNYGNSNAVLSGSLTKEAVVQPTPTSQSLNVQQSTDQQTNYPQTGYPQATQENDDCNKLNNCQQPTKCTHSFIHAWGWIFICHGW